MLPNMPLISITAFNQNGRLSQILKLSLAVVGLGLTWRFHQPLWALLSVVGDREAIAASLDQFGILAPLLLGVILILQVIVAAIPGHALMVSGGYVFGFAPAFAISLTTTVIGSQIAFMLARWAGRPLVERLAPVDLLNKWSNISAKKGLIFFLFAFMLPIFPADVMNYIAGLSALSARRFFIANLFGRMPGVVLMTAVGAYGFQLSITTWVGIAVAAAVMFLIWRAAFVNK